MTVNQTHPTPNVEPPYQDPQRPNGVAPPDAQTPSWFQEAMGGITKAIFDVVHFSQHEYLDKRRLPHAIKLSEVLVKPHLLKTREVIVQTIFPIASELCFVAFYTPIFENGALTMAGDPQPADDVRVLGYTLSAVHNTPQRPEQFVLDELSRQGKELGLRHPQFLYFTIMKPQYAEAFDDPNGYLGNQNQSRGPVNAVDTVTDTVTDTIVMPTSV
jgi:hypothetical protein